MNEKQIADKMASIVKDYISASIEPLKLQIANQKEVIANLESDVDEKDKAIKSLITENEIKLLEHQRMQDDLIDKSFGEMSSAVDDNFKILSDSVNEKIESKSEVISLKLDNTISGKLLTMSDHINTKLNHLKGDKGDAGEKGEKGDSGFISGVSTWENGVIAKKYQAFRFKNALWLCKADQTAGQPGINDEWDLLVDGVCEFSLHDADLVVSYASGLEKTIGRVGLVHKGPFEQDATYSKGDIVTVDKTSFVSTCDNNSNKPPSNTWKLLSGRGAKGSKGEKGQKGDSYNQEDLQAIIEEIITSRGE